MVGLDGLRRAAHRTRLDYIGIKRSLHQPVHVPLLPLDLVGFLFKNGDELVADNLALLFGISHTRELGKKSGGGIYRIHSEFQAVTEILLYFAKFVFAKHAIVDEDA